jgi:hypothetical protein
MTTDTAKDSMANVKLFLRKGENDLHWYLRDLFLHEAKTHQIGMTAYLTGLKRNQYKLPGQFSVEEWYASVLDLYKPEVDSCMKALTFAQKQQLVGKDKVLWCARQLISAMYTQYGVK